MTFQTFKNKKTGEEVSAKLIDEHSYQIIDNSCIIAKLMNDGVVFTIDKTNFEQHFEVKNDKAK